MNVVFTVGFTGAADSDDTLAARHAIAVENKLRINDPEPPDPPLPQLPTATPAEVKASYLSIMLKLVTARHVLNIAEMQSSISVKERLTPGQMAQINKNLNTRLNAGEAAASIVADTAS